MMITHKAVQSTEYNKIITTTELNEAPIRTTKVSNCSAVGVGVTVALVLEPIEK